MKKWHFPALFVTIVVAVAIGANFGSIYDKAMFGLTGDCRYWHPAPEDTLMNDEARQRMSVAELSCALDKFNAQMRRQNGMY